MASTTSMLAFTLMVPLLVGCKTIPGAGGSGTGGSVVARLTATESDVRVERSGQVVAYAPAMPLRTGDRVETGLATVATIEFTDGNTIYMNHDTSVEVGSIRVFLGEIFNWVTHVGASSETYTNDLSAAAEGTKYLMRTDPRGTTVIVLEGRVRCTPTSGGAWHPITLTPNQRISGTVLAYTGPAPVDSRREALWADQAARRLKRPPVLPQPQPTAPPSRVN